MGNVSSTVQRAVTEVTNSSKSSCTNAVGIKQDLSVMLDLTDTNCPNLVFGNTAKSVSTCNMGAIADSLAAASVNLSKEQTAGLGLGLNVSSSVLERKTAIQQYLEQKCGSTTAIEQSNSVKLKAKNLNCEQLQAFNNADATQQCVINAVLQVVDKQDATEAVKQKTDILGSLTALLATGPLLILGAVLLGFGVLYLVLRGLRGAASSATATEATAETGAEGEVPADAVADAGTEGEAAPAEGASEGSAAAGASSQRFQKMSEGLQRAIRMADSYLANRKYQ